MRFFSILMAFRLMAIAVFPLAAFAQEFQNTNTLQNENQNFIEIRNGEIRDVVFYSFGERRETLANSVLKAETIFTVGDSGLNKKILGYYKNIETVVPLKGKVQIVVTGYSSTVDQCDSSPFITASGTHVHHGTMACPKLYPFGTKIKIDGVGTFVCEDRGGAIKGNRFDMWFESRQAALNWGRRSVEAEIEME